MRLLRPSIEGLAMTNRISEEVNAEDISCWGWGKGAYPGLEASPEP